MHVLSTPPAFILSQDQTLDINLIKTSESSADFSLSLFLTVLKVSSLRMTSALHRSERFASFAVSGQRRFAPCPPLRSDPNPSDRQACHPRFRSLRGVLTLFQNLQGCFTVQLSKNSGLSSERRRRDLNPRAAVNDLHPFQGCPFGQLGYFSTEIHMPESHGGEVCLHLIQLRPNSSALRPSGEDGIRTHAPLRTNGFQDRLVMTTSIPLQ